MPKNKRLHHGVGAKTSIYMMFLQPRAMDFAKVLQWINDWCIGWPLNRGTRGKRCLQGRAGLFHNISHWFWRPPCCDPFIKHQSGRNALIHVRKTITRQSGRWGLRGWWGWRAWTPWSAVFSLTKESRLFSTRFCCYWLLWARSWSVTDPKWQH